MTSIDQFTDVLGLSLSNHFLALPIQEPLEALDSQTVTVIVIESTYRFPQEEQNGHRTSNDSL